MAKNKKFTTGDYLALGLLAFGEVCKSVADTEQVVFVPRGTNIGFSNPDSAREYAEKYLGGSQTIVANPLPNHVVSETRTPSLYGERIVRYYSDGSTETVEPGIFGPTVKRTNGYTHSATVIRTVSTPIDRQSRRPSTLDGNRVFQSLTDWEWR